MRQDSSPQLRRRNGCGALLADGNRGCRVRHPQRRLPIRACCKRQRKRCGHRVARAGDVAHFHRKRRHVNGFALARHQRHAVLALRHQDRLAIGELHGVLRGIGDGLVGIGAAAGGFGEFLAVGRQQRRAAIDREIGALGIDDHPLIELLRAVDDVADHARRQHALGIVGQQHDIGAGEQRQDGVDQFLLDLAGCRLSQLPIGAQHMGREMLGDEAHLAGRRPRGVANQHAFDPAFLRQRLLKLRAGLVLADQPDKDAASAERGDIARDVAGAADIGLAALGRDDRRRRLRRNPRHLAIDELVQHEIADAEHGPAHHQRATGRQNRTSVLVPNKPSAETIGAIEKTLHVERDRIFECGEAAIIAGAAQPIDRRFA